MSFWCVPSQKKQLYDNLRTKLGASGITQSLHAIQYVLICFVFNGISLLLWNGGGTDFSFYMFVSNHRFLQTQDVFQPSVYWIHKLGLNPIRHISSLHLTGDGASSEKAPSNSTNLTTAMHPCILSNWGNQRSGHPSSVAFFFHSSNVFFLQRKLLLSHHNQRCTTTTAQSHAEWLEITGQELTTIPSKQLQWCIMYMYMYNQIYHVYIYIYDLIIVSVYI